MTLLRLRPDHRKAVDHQGAEYKRSVEFLYVEIAQHYVNSILWDDYYSSWHGLSEQRRTQQLMSMLYSARRLHQHFDLPSWVPDWTFAWYQAPFWCTTDANLMSFSARDDWTTGIRSSHRAGGDKLESFELVDGAPGKHHLRISALRFDTIIEASETTPASTPAAESNSPTSPFTSTVTLDASTFSYDRDFFKTAKGSLGMATRGVQSGDVVAVLLSGDVPVILRPDGRWDSEGDAYTLLCECFVQSNSVMDGELIRQDLWLADDITLI